MKKLKKIMLLFLPFMLACATGEKPEFEEWYQIHKESASKLAQPRIYHASFYSDPLQIDTIYRSMEGPYDEKSISIEAEEELIWLVGYESKVENVEEGFDVLSDKFMCHNNLNYSERDQIPWKIETKAGNNRIFTLTKGQSKLQLPEGFGIPVPANSEFQLVSQVLNHQEKEINISTRQKVTINYIKDSELANPLKALYQQSIFVTKQISGPSGEHGFPRLCMEEHKDSSNLGSGMLQHNCSVKFDEKEYNPYRDQQGRKYTGHWVLPVGKEVLATDVTQMMELNNNSRIHAIGVHLHPFAEGLQLWDKTMDSLFLLLKLKTVPMDLALSMYLITAAKKGFRYLKIIVMN